MIFVTASDIHTPPGIFCDIHAYGEHTSCHHHLCSRGRLCGSSHFQIGCGIPLFLTPSMLTISNHGITMFAVGDGADPFVCQ